jgi:hypothetical protein
MPNLSYEFMTLAVRVPLCKYKTCQIYNFVLDFVLSARYRTIKNYTSYWAPAVIGPLLQTNHCEDAHHSCRQSSPLQGAWEGVRI